MSDCTITYRTVKLEILKDWHINFLKFIFDSTGDDIKVDRNKPLGKYLCSFTRSADYPIQFDKNKKYVTLILPNNQYFRNKDKFLYYSFQDTQLISDQLDSIAHFHHDRMLHAGKSIHMTRKRVIEIFSTRIYGEKSYDALVKSEYREREFCIKWLQDAAKELGYS